MQGKSYRLKVEAFKSGTVTFQLLWLVPGSSTYVAIPSDFLFHEEGCDSPCQNGGCCVGHNVCRCQPGFTGEDCSVAMNTCTDGNLPVNVIAGGLKLRYFNDSAMNNLVQETTDMNGINENWATGAPLTGMRLTGTSSARVGPASCARTSSAWHRLRIAYATSSSITFYFNNELIFSDTSGRLFDLDLSHCQRAVPLFALISARSPQQLLRLPCGGRRPTCQSISFRIAIGSTTTASVR